MARILFSHLLFRVVLAISSAIYIPFIEIQTKAEVFQPQVRSRGMSNGPRTITKIQKTLGYTDLPQQIPLDHRILRPPRLQSHLLQQIIRLQ